MARRRGRKRAPLTARKRFWMRLISSIVIVICSAFILFIALALWNNIYALVFTAFVLFMLSGFPIIHAYRRTARAATGARRA